MVSGFEFPEDKQRVIRKARRLEWITIVYLLSVVGLVGLVLGQSQAMKAAWIEDMLSIIPAAVFLIGHRISQWEPTPRFPYGFHRVTSAAYLAAAAALSVVGTYLLIDSLLKLIEAEHPTIGLSRIFGYEVWLGWLMIAALIYSLVPAAIIGRMKVPLAEQIYDKVIYTDAKMQKADWMTAGAAIVGIIGIGFGYWWADAAAGILISLDILRDGYSHLTVALFDLIDQTPRTLDGSKRDPLVGKVEAKVRGLDWVRDAEVRLRVSGHTIFGEADVVPSSVEDLPGKIERAVREIRDLDWRLHHFTLTPVPNLSRSPEEKVR
jgi:cation diffusion facilitator family transporter